MENQNWKTVKQVAQENNCNERTVQKWCTANDVPYSGNGFRKEWKIFPEHEKAFKERERPGRRWHKEVSHSPAS
ncbi:MAG: hypothetical protein ACTTH8_08345 [Treponema sp.]